MLRKLLVAFAAAFLLGACEQSQPVAAPPPPPPVAAPQVFTVLFDTGRSTLSAQGRGTIQQATAAYKSAPGAGVTVTGHTDTVGSPDLNQALSFFGSIWYYPDVHGSYTNASTAPISPLSFNLAYNILKYQIGLSYVIGNSPVYLEGGWMGDSWTNKQNAPVNRSYNGPFAGIGFRLLYP